MITNLAVSGYDAVAYFKLEKAIEGSKQFEVKWQNAVWRFSSKENMEQFQKSPEKYAPQYGGFCAWAVGNNYTASADPTCWKVVNGKLYLNYNKSVQEKWQKEMDSLIQSADKNWETLRKE